MASNGNAPSRAAKDFIRSRIDRDLAEGRFGGVVTRFPPEPNGYLHIGHAKSICLNFALAAEYGGRCHLRFDDTNPLTEEEEYSLAIAADVRWLGFDWGSHLHHASDLFDRMWEVAEGLIRNGDAYVDSASEEEIREARGTVTEPGHPTPDRSLSPPENLDLFRRMRAGEFLDGSRVLRAKIDLASPNMLMRDPVLYRIRHASHYRTGDRWCVYPLYDFAHCLEDAFEGVTHSLCTLEFENNRELYDWILDRAGFSNPRPYQTEFARLNLDHTVLSKRKLIRLVREGHVTGWDDPRMPTLAGLRRRGVPPRAIRNFAEAIGIARSDSRVDPARLDFEIREVLNVEAPRFMAVARPVPLTVRNWPGGIRSIEAPLFPDRAEEGPTRTIGFEGALLVDAEDVALDPPPGWKRIAPGRIIRLRHACLIRCDEIRVDPRTGEVTEVLATADLTSFGSAGEGWKSSGTLHWVPSSSSIPAELRLYGHLFTVAEPEAGTPEGGDFTDFLNPDSLLRESGARVEAAIAGLGPEARVQFERKGYFAFDPDGDPSRPILNRIVPLRDGWERERRQSDTPETVRTPARPAAGAPRSGGGDRSSGPAGPSGGRVRERARRDDPSLMARYRRLQEELGLSEGDADRLTPDHPTTDFFEAALREHPDPVAVAGWMNNEVRALLGDEGRVGILPFDGRALGLLVALVAGGEVPRSLGREILSEMARSGNDPRELVKRSKAKVLADEGALREVIRSVLGDRPEKVAEYRSGKNSLLGLFMGDVMRRTGGVADPAVVRRILVEALGGGA